MNKDQFIDLVARCKRNFPGKSERGLDNYHLSQIRGAASISGPISLQLKIAITLRLTRTLTLHTLSFTNDSCLNILSTCSNYGMNTSPLKKSN